MPLGLLREERVRLVYTQQYRTRTRTGEGVARTILSVLVRTAEALGDNPTAKLQGFRTLLRLSLDEGPHYTERGRDVARKSGRYAVSVTQKGNTLLECHDVECVATVRGNKIGVGSCEDYGSRYKDVFEFAPSWVTRGQESLESAGVATQLGQW